MSDNLHPAIEKSHQVFDTVWKTLPSEQKEAIKGLVQAIGELERQILDTMDPQDPPRFPDSRYVAFTSQHGSLVLPTSDGAGVLWEITTRADTLDEILGQLMAIQKVALRAGFIPADRYIDQCRQERTETQPSYQSPPVATPGSPQGGATSQPNGQTMVTQLFKVAAGPLSDKDTTLVYKGMTGKSKHLVNIYMDSGAEAIKKLAILGLDPNRPSSLFAKDVTEIPTPGWTCLVGLTEDGKWANKILDITPAK